MSLQGASPPRARGQVSVCMATWNGAMYVEEQLYSILEQLLPDDEVVVVDDASSDDTVSIVSAIPDPRIHLTVRNENRGYVRTFEQALGLASGEYLFLADQDDVWIPGRVDAMVNALANHQVVVSNLSSLGGPNSIPGPFLIKDWRVWSRDSNHPIRNVVKLLAGLQCYWGCAMAMRRDALEYLLPFPEFLTETHDQWIGLCGNLAGSIEHLDVRTVWRRVHDTNLTPNQPRGVIPALRSRIVLIRSAYIACRRLFIRWHQLGGK